MDSIRKIWFLLSRTFLLLAGVLLLIIAIPHKDPWNMSQVGVQAGKGQVTVNFPIVDSVIQTSVWNVFIATGIALLALTLLTSSGRRAVVNCLRRVTPIPVILLAMSALVFTLKPTSNGMPIVVYLTFGALGLLFCLGLVIK